MRTPRPKRSNFPSMSAPDSGADDGKRFARTGETFIVTRNHSLSGRGAWLVVGAFGCAGLVISVFFVSIGAWPVAPFAGAELILVGTVFYRMQRRSLDRETIRVDERTVYLHRRVGSSESESSWDRHWVRVTLEQPARRFSPFRLWIGSHGRRDEIGAWVTDEEKASLATRLNAALE